MTGEGLEEGLDWLTSKLNQKHKVSAQSAKESNFITKLPDHDKKAKLTDLTMEDQPVSMRGVNIDDLEQANG